MNALRLRRGCWTGKGGRLWCARGHNLHPLRAFSPASDSVSWPERLGHVWQDLGEVQQAMAANPLSLLEDAALSNSQWNSVLGFLLFALVVLGAGVSLAGSWAEAIKREEAPWLPRGEVAQVEDELRRTIGEPKQHSIEEQRRQVGVLRRAERQAEDEQTIIFLFLSWGLFEIAAAAFSRTPETPLSP